MVANRRRIKVDYDQAHSYGRLDKCGNFKMRITVHRGSRFIRAAIVPNQPMFPVRTYFVMLRTGTTGTVIVLYSTVVATVRITFVWRKSMQIFGRIISMTDRRRCLIKTQLYVLYSTIAVLEELLIESNLAGGIGGAVRMASC